MNATNKYMILALLAGTAGSVSAQDVYDAQALMESDLNGTARYVGMGGALGALGGDISTMGSNPAGTALYRKGDMAFSIGEFFTSNKGAMGHDKSRLSFDQAGGVMVMDMGNPTSKGLQYVNLGFNYQKRRNFLTNNGLSVDNLNGSLSQTFQIADMANVSWDNDSWGLLTDNSIPLYNEDGSQKALGIICEDDQGYFGVGAKDAYYERATFGANNQYDFNLSFNVSDRFFYGLSLGIYDMSFTRESFYSELGVDGALYDIDSWYKLKGSGADLKLGFICRPFEDSNFRFGFNVHTPTWYDVVESNGATFTYDDNSNYYADNGDYDYNFRTSWKIGVSLGHTVSNYLAIGAEYEFSDLSTAHYSESEYNTGGGEYFRNVNQQMENTLKGQHTLKLGAELKATDDVAFRIGYNYISTPFKSGAYRVLSYDGPYTDTSYMNWNDTNRLTLGVGFRFNGGYFDLAYQYQEQTGDFYAFDNYDSSNPIYTLKPTKIENSRTQIMATLGFRF